MSDATDNRFYREPVPSKSLSRRGRGKWSDKITDDDYRAKLRGLCKVNAKGCWVYQGWCHPKPREYGTMFYRGKQYRTHRLSYLLHKGPIPAGMVVCHSCDNQKCCNPDHLWAGTQHQNLLDCRKKDRHANALKSVCKRGHPLSGSNLEVWGNLRRCKICHLGRMRVRAGWPVHLAFNPKKVPSGYTREVLK